MNRQTIAQREALAAMTPLPAPAPPPPPVDDLKVPDFLRRKKKEKPMTQGI